VKLEGMRFWKHVVPLDPTPVLMARAEVRADLEARGIPVAPGDLYLWQVGEYYEVWVSEALWPAIARAHWE